MLCSKPSYLLHARHARLRPTFQFNRSSGWRYSTNVREHCDHSSSSLKRFSNYSRLPNRFWENKENREKYLSFVKEQLGGSLEHFYEASTATIIQTGGAGLLRYHKGSLLRALEDVYPDHNWEPWRFKTQSPRHVWSNLGIKLRCGDEKAVKVARTYMEELGRKHGITTLEDWYHVTGEKIGSTASRHLKSLGGLATVLEYVYPHHKWERARFYSHTAHMRTSAQFALKANISESIPFSSKPADSR